MDVTQAIRSRRSIRKYKSGVKIPQKDLDLILEAAMMAPSARNTRPWEFFVLEKEEIRKSIVDIAPYSSPILSSSLAILVCGRPDLQPGGPERWFFPQDCGAAIENLLLQAHALGYGTVWCGLYPVKEWVEGVQKLLQIESVPMAVIAVGAPDESPDARGYYDQTCVHYL